MRTLKLAAQLNWELRQRLFWVFLSQPWVTHLQCHTHIYVHLCTACKEGAEVSWGWMWGINTAASPAALLFIWTVADGEATPFSALYRAPVSSAHICVRYAFIRSHQSLNSLTSLCFPRCWFTNSCPWLGIRTTANCAFNKAVFVACYWQRMRCTEPVCCVVGSVFSYAALFISSHLASCYGNEADTIANCWGDLVDHGKCSLSTRNRRIFAFLWGLVTLKHAHTCIRDTNVQEPLQGFSLFFVVWNAPFCVSVCAFFSFLLPAWNCRHPQPTHFSKPSFNSHPPPQSAANISVYTHLHSVFCSNSGDRCDIPPSVCVCVFARPCACVWYVCVSRGGVPSGPYWAESLLQRLNAGEQPSLLRSLFFPSHSSSLSFTPSLIPSLSLSLTPYHSVSRHPSLSPFSPSECPTLSTFKQHIPLRLHKVALLPPPPLCVSLFLHSFTLLIPPSIHPSPFLYRFLSIKASLHPPISLLQSQQLLLFIYPLSFPCILLYLLPCHFPPFSALILSLGSSFFPALPAFGLPFLFCLPYLTTILSVKPQLAVAAPVLLYIAPPPPCSRLLSLQPYLSSVPLWPVGPWPRQHLCLGTKSAGRTNIADVICLRLHLWHVSASLCPYLYMLRCGQERSVTALAWRTTVCVSFSFTFCPINPN